MSDLLSLKRIFLPLNCVVEAYTHMRRNGAYLLEGVALFSGTVSNQSFYVERTIIPKQNAVRLEYGLMYSVESEELHRIQVDLHNNKLALISQIHSHPSQAYHSEMDDRFPIVTKVGSLSIVVPNFAMDDIQIANWAVYRLSRQVVWEKLDLKTISELIAIT